MTLPWLDRFGTVASTACAVHCGAVAFVPALLSLIGLGFLQDERFEWIFLTFAVGFAVGAGWSARRLHREGWVTIGFALGVLSLVAARAGEMLGVEGSVVLALVGGVVLVVSHGLNLRASRESTCSTG
jgi:peptidoglycan/LPS O-acetylase OafA/YrhL